MAKKHSSNTDPDSPMVPDPVTAPDIIVPAPEPAGLTLTTSEGVSATWIEVGTLLVAEQPKEARAFELHVDGKTFTHVSDDGDRWVYRYVK